MIYIYQNQLNSVEAIKHFMCVYSGDMDLILAHVIADPLKPGGEVSQVLFT